MQNRSDGVSHRYHLAYFKDPWKWKGLYNRKSMSKKGIASIAKWPLSCARFFKLLLRLLAFQDLLSFFYFPRNESWDNCSKSCKSRSGRCVPVSSLSTPVHLEVLKTLRMQWSSALTSYQRGQQRFRSLIQIPGELTKKHPSGHRQTSGAKKRQ